METNPKPTKEGQKRNKRLVGLLTIGLIVAILLPLTIGLTAYDRSDSPSADAVSAKTSGKESSSVPSVDVTPNWPIGTDNLVSSVSNVPTSTRRVPTSISFAWYKNGVQQTALTGSTVDASYTAKGESWKCVVTAKVVKSGRTVTYSNFDEVTVQNTPPTAPAVDVTPDLPLTADSLVASIVSPSSDADEDAIAYTHAWYKNGVLQPQFTGNTVDASYTAKGETWKCIVTASDGTGTSAGFDQVGVQNNPPTAPIVNVTPDLPDTAENLVCSVVVPSSDPDGDAITYTYAWQKNNALQAQLTTNTVDASYTTVREVWKCVVTASDGAGSSAGSFDEVTISSGNETPTAPQVDVTPDIPLETDNLVCSITVPSSDPDGDPVTYSYSWYRNDVLQTQLTGDTVDASYTLDGETWRCVVTASDDHGATAGSFDEVTIPSANNSPSAPAVAISPTSPTTTDSLVCSIVTPSSDADGDPLTYTYAWHKNSVLQTGLTGNTVNASYTARGETWKCIVTVTDGAGGSAGSFDEVAIQNSTPTAPVADVTPDLPATADSLVCSVIVASTDADGDAMTYAYAWYKNSVLQTGLTGSTVNASYTTRGEAWKCIVTVTDGAGGSAGSFDEVTIHNSTPTAPVADVTPDLPVTADSLVCSVKAASTDADGDSITYTYTWSKNGVLQAGLTGSTVNASYTTRGETWKCVLTASDGAGGTSTAFDEVTIHNTPPTAPAVDVTPDEPVDADNLVCAITTASSDADGDTVTYAYAWYKNSVLQTGLTTNTVNASYTGEGQTWRCVVTASDGNDGSASSYDQVTTASTVTGPRSPGNVNCLVTYGTGWRYVTNATDRNHLIMAMTDFGCNTLELQIDASVFGNMVENPGAIATGITALNAAGIQVWADWNSRNVGWDDEVEGYSWHEFCDVILKWNKDHPTAKFTALEFDLEPPGGSTLEQHSTFLQGVYAGMQTMRTHTVDGTETIASQALPVVMFCDLRWGNTTCATAWGQVVSQLDVVEMEYYRCGGGGYPDGIQYSVANAASALAVVIAQGRYFTCILSCDELPKTYEASDPYLSRFNLGRAAYEQATQDYVDYYNGVYPGKCVGCSTYFDVGGFMYWFNIDSVTSWPSGSTKAGDTLTVSYQTRRRTDRHTDRVFGVQMELRDSNGTVSKANQIIDLIDGQTTDRSITLTVPSDLASGAASVRLTMWMVGWYNEGYYDKLYYEDYSGHQSELLAMTMDQLAATTTGPNGTLQGKRSTFFILQDSGWQSGITVEGGTAAAPVTIPPVVSSTGASGTGTNSATLNGNLSSLGSASPVPVSFEWGLTTSYGSVTTPIAKTATGSFSTGLIALTANTTYHFRAKATGDGTAYGSDMTFTTGSLGPAVTTRAATGVGTAAATLNGDLFSLGSASPVQVSFEWGLTTSYGSVTTPIAKTATGSFSTSLIALTANTTYHFRAKATGDGTAYGSDMVVTTGTLPDAVALAISSVKASRITFSRATVTWTTNEAATSLVEYGLTEGYGSSSRQDLQLGTSHSVTLTGLKANRTYHYRVISSDASGNQAVSGDYSVTTAGRSDRRLTWVWVGVGLAAVGVGGGGAWFGSRRLAKK